MQNLTKKLVIWGGVVFILLVFPLSAMLFHIKVYDPGSGYEEMNWTLRDFVYAAILLYGSGFVYIMATKNMSNQGQRLLVGAIVFIALALIWVAAATGFHGVPDMLDNLTD